MWYAYIINLSTGKVNVKRNASEKLFQRKAKKIKRLLLRTISFGLSGGNWTHSLSLRRRLRYPITLRKDFNVLKVIKRNKNYKIYTNFYTDFIFYVDKTQYMVYICSIMYYI